MREVDQENLSEGIPVKDIFKIYFIWEVSIYTYLLKVSTP
jgi:hypothetical protein